MLQEKKSSKSSMMDQKKKGFLSKILKSDKMSKIAKPIAGMSGMKKGFEKLKKGLSK